MLASTGKILPSKRMPWLSPACYNKKVTLRYFQPENANSRLFLTVYYVLKLSSLLAAIKAKIIGPQVGKKAVPDEQALWNDPTA